MDPIERAVKAAIISYHEATTVLSLTHEEAMDYALRSALVILASDPGEESVEAAQAESGYNVSVGMTEAMLHAALTAMVDNG